MRSVAVERCDLVLGEAKLLCIVDVVVEEGVEFVGVERTGMFLSSIRFMRCRSDTAYNLCKYGVKSAPTMIAYTPTVTARPMATLLAVESISVWYQLV